MGKILKNCSILGELHGKIGNHVYAETKYGTQVKAKPSGHIEITAGQMQEMDYMEYIAKVYGTLTEKEAMRWRECAMEPAIRHMYTKKSHLDGRNLFFAVNMKRIELGEPVILSKPKFEPAQGFHKINAEIMKTGNKRDIIFEISPNIDKNTKVVVTATRGLKDNLIFVHPAEYKKIVILDSGFVSGSSIKANYLDVFKKMPEGDKKICFFIKSFNKECGTGSMPRSFTAKQYEDEESRLKERQRKIDEYGEILRRRKRLE